MMNLVDVMNNIGVTKLNTFTKYPSIQTYHEIDRGCLKSNLTDNVGFDSSDVYITEKIDGTNGRILILNGDYIIGSREELLYRKGDIFGNPSQGIVDIMKPFADYMSSKIPNDNTLYIFYGEVYGSNINGAKQYTKTKQSNVRFFDCIKTDVNHEILNRDIEYISLWREHGGQDFISVIDLHKTLDDINLSDNIVPYIVKTTGDSIPVSRAHTYEWLKRFSATSAAIDDGMSGKAEGVVVRTEDRKIIRKIRFEDYEKTLRKQGEL